MPCVEVPTSKVNHNGIETIPAVTYQGWEPGKEYTKNIVLKNVMVKTQKLTYNSPSSRFFSTLYPKQITLSAGTSYVLPVTFRPLEKNIYEDHIYFASKEGQFSIPIKAILPVFNIATPDQLVMQTCAVKDEIQMSFTIQNKSELVTPFQWDVQEPFTVEPATGTLQPHSSAKMTVYFRPSAALVYECHAKCLHGTNFDSISTTVFHGTGKYPQLLVAPASNSANKQTETKLSFGSTPIGTSGVKSIDVYNLGQVEAKCTVEHQTSLSAIDHVFSCPVTRIIVPPMDYVRVQVRYTPCNVNTSSLDHIYINSLSDVGKMTITCSGHCVGPDVKLSANLLNFSLTNVDAPVTRVVHLTNDSPAHARYQFMIDCGESAFKFDETSGDLAPGQTKKVIVIFAPQHPINYYRNVSCVVENQPPIFLELIATAHSETVKPAVLEPKHLAQFRVHAERGLSVFPPEQLNEMLATGKLELDANNMLMNVLAESIEPWLNPIEEVPAMDLYFNDGYHSDIVHCEPHVSLDAIHADFGRCTDMNNIEPQLVRLTNNTKGKMMVQWMGDETHTFSVTPSSAEIPPLKTVDFRVHFKPASANNLYSSELECYCYYKSTRDYRLVESLTHCPPFCVTLTALASTFQSQQQPFLPQISLSSPHLVFPATNQDEASYRTLTVINQGTTPIIYDFPDMETFSVKPKKGMIKSKHETLLVKALPTKTKAYREQLALCMNHEDSFTQVIPVTCTAETAEVLLSNNGEIFFRETCVGTTTSQSYQIKNISRVPLDFRWLIKNQDQGLIKVEPAIGTILPNEFQEHVFSFTPMALEKYVMKPTVIVTAQGQSKQQSAGKPRVFPVRAIGEGASAEVKAEDAYVEFGNVLVGSSSTQVFNICNDGDCEIKFKLSVTQKIEGSSAAQALSANVALTLDCYSGDIPARSKKTIRGVIKPLLRCQYSFEIKYSLLTPELSCKESPPEHLINAFACGVFPLMAVTDARIHGSGIGIGKRQLWSLFQLDSLNMFLDSDPSDRELQYSVQTRNSTRRRPPVFTRAILDCNFGAAPVDSEPCYVTLHVENTGTVESEWEFLFPNDLQIDLECWSESGEYTEDELHEMKVMDNKLFSVSPKKGKLQAGETCSITFTYHHLMSGTDRVPVLLKLSRGREILMNFVGVTVEHDTPYIHFPSNKHSFAPVAVGEKRCPKQVYELYNGGAVPVTFDIDCMPLMALKRENFGHPVLDCLNPQGVIEPGKTHVIEWMFYPLEAKTYDVDVPIYISGGEPALITFTGVGYDKTQLGETMPTVSDNCEGDVPPMQMVTVPGQTVVLSHERISFGNVPLFSKTRKVTFMCNTSEHTVSFAWHVTNTGDQKVVNIYPAKGTLQPRGSQMVKVAFTAFGEPAFYDMDMICEITDETEMAKYRRRLRDWERERERQIHEFTITEKDLARSSAPRSKGSAPGAKSESVLAINSSSAHKDLYSASPKSKTYKSYKTLPPILDRSVDKDREDAIEAEKMAAAMWPKPVPPKPFLIHLGIVARTHSISTFQEQFFDEFSNFFIDKTLGQTESVDVEDSVADDKQAPDLTCTESESQMLQGVIANVLRSLVDDTSFHQSVTKLTNESTPYFSQFRPGFLMKTEALADGTEEVTHSEKPMVNTSSQKELLVEKSAFSPEAKVEPEHTTTRVSPPNRPASSGKKTHKSRKGKTSPLAGKSRDTPNESVTRIPAFANLVEDVLENTLMNILLESANNEVNITARPRLIALPPRKFTPSKDPKH